MGATDDCNRSSKYDGTHQLALQNRVPPVTPVASPIEQMAVGEDVPSPEDGARSKMRLIVILTALFAALFVAALDQTIMATVIPTISTDLHSAAGYTWIGGANLLANAAAAPIWAKLSDIWGRKPLLLTAIALFFSASLICALSENMSMLLVGRALQGCGGGGTMEMVSITISDLFSMRSRALYLGLLEFVWCLAGALGPLLGGVFAQYATWRWAFWVNLPVAGPTFVLLFLFLDVHNPKTRLSDGLKAIDWFGSVAIVGVTVMLLLGLSFGGEAFPWDSPKVICLIVAGCVLCIFFVFGEKKLAKYPVMPPSLFDHRSKIACLVIAHLHGAIYIAGEYYLPLFMQSVFSASALRSGVLTLPLTTCEALGGGLSGYLIHRTGRYREQIWTGLCLLTLGTGLYIHLDAHSSIPSIIMSEIIGGIGAGMLFTPPLIALQAMVAPEDMATATATLGFVRNLGAAMFIVIGGVVLQNGMANRDRHLADAGLPRNITEAFSGADATANIVNIVHIPDEGQRKLVREAFAWSLQKMWILYTGLAGVALVASAFVVRKTLSTVYKETRTGLKKEKEEVRIAS